MIRTWTPESDEPKPGEVDYRTVKAWFQQCRDLADEIDNIQLEVQRLLDNATKCTASMSGMPGGSGYGDKITFAIEKMDSERRRREELQRQLMGLQAEASRRIKYIAGTKSSEQMRMCLYEYYILNEKQVVVARDLKLPNENRVALYIREGCKRLALIWDVFM